MMSQCVELLPLSPSETGDIGQAGGWFLSSVVLIRNILLFILHYIIYSGSLNLNKAAYIVLSAS